MFTHSSTAGAHFSPDGQYRYRLWRCWDKRAPAVLWVMLNPSTADATYNDPTIERCEQRARRGGYGALWVANLFGLRTPNPGDLRHHPHPVGPENDCVLHYLASRADAVVCAWGNHGQYLGRGDEVAALLRRANQHLLTLGTTRRGQPRHPLYVAYQRSPEPATTILTERP